MFNWWKPVPTSVRRAGLSGATHAALARQRHDHAVLFESPGGEVLAYAVYEEQAFEIYLRQFLVLGRPGATASAAKCSGCCAPRSGARTSA